MTIGQLRKAAGFLLFAVLSVPLAYLPMIENSYALPKSLLLQSIALLLVIIISVFLFASGRRIDLAWWDAALAILAAFLIVATLVSSQRDISFWGSYSRYEGLITWLSYFAVYFGASIFLRGKTSSVVEAVVWASLPVSLISIWQYIAAARLDFRAFGTLGSPPYLGSFFSMALPLAVALAFFGSGWTKAAGISATAIGLPALYFSFTRGAWIATAFAVAIVAVIFLKRHQKDFLKTAAAILLLSVLFLSIVALSSGGRAYDYASARLRAAGNISSGTIATRLEMWRGTIPLIRDKPLFGWGPETFRENFKETEKLAALENEFKRADRPHNHFLYLVYAAGIIGALSYYVFAAGLIRAGFFSPGINELAEAPVIKSVAAALIGYQIQAEFLFSSAAASPVWWLLAGLLAGTLVGSNEKPRERAQVRRGVTAVLAVGAILLAAWIYHGGRLLYADYNFKIGKAALETGETESVKALETAGALYPGSRVYKLALGHAYFAQGKAAGSRATVEQAIDVYSEAADDWADDEFYYSLGDALAYYGVQWDAGLLDDALAAYRQAAELNPYFPYTYWEMGYIYALKGDYDEAVPLYKKSLRLDPANTAAYADLAAAYEKTDRPKTAAAYYRKALELDPDFIPAANGLRRLRSAP